MSLHQYHCSSCESDFELNIGLLEGQYFIQFEPDEKEEQELIAQDKDPRDYWVEIPVDDIPLNPPCIYCQSLETYKIINEFNGWCKGVCFTNIERERKFYQKGMDRKQATEFYKDSMQASKERMSQGKQHYKKVDMDVNHYAKHGMVKPTKNKAKKVEAIHKLNAELVKPLDKKK